MTALLSKHLNGHNCRTTEKGKKRFYDTTESARNYTPDWKLSATASPTLFRFYCKPTFCWNQYSKISINPGMTNHTNRFTWKQNPICMIYLPSQVWFRLQAHAFFQKKYFQDVSFFILFPKSFSFFPKMLHRHPVAKLWKTLRKNAWICMSYVYKEFKTCHNL